MLNKGDAMKKKFCISIIMLMTAIIVFGSFVGCRKQKEENETYWNNGIHEIKVSEGTADFIKSGLSEYTIVIPENASLTIEKAATEIVTNVQNASGIVLDVVKEPQGKTDKIISVGNTKAAKDADALPLSVSEKLGDLGVRVYTKNSNVYLLGNTDNGSLYSVYTWLHYQLGFETYGVDEVALMSDVENLKLKEMDIVDVPDIPYMQSTYGFTDYNATFRDRMRMPDLIFMPVNGDTWHNSFSYIDPDTYSYKKEWFSDDRTQLCYTAHGNEAQLSGMIDVVLEKIKEILTQEPAKTHITITHEDSATWCTCATCSALKEKYGTDAVSVIRFCNQVSRTLNKWFETESGKPYKRDLQIAFFAYHATEPAPAKYDEKEEKYVPIDETVVCDDNVGVIYAPISATYQKNFSSEYNKDYKKIFDGWGAVTKNIYMWTYSTNFHYYLVPTNTYNSMQYNYRLWASGGVVWLLDQAQFNNPQSTGFSALKLYLNTKLRWNVNENINDLTDAFFANYFGPAAESMRKYFEEFRAHSQYLEDEMNYIGNCYLEPLDQKYWPKTLLERWIGYCDQAIEDLEALKEKDPILYKIYRDNIVLESISPRYLLLDLWSNRFGESELKDMRNQFRNDCLACEITQYAEKVPISDLWSKWGI